MPLIKLNPDIVRQSVNAMQAVLREIEDITRDVGSRYDDWSAPEKADMDTMAVDCKRYGDALSVIANAHCANARRAVEVLVNEDAAQRRNVEDLSAGTAAVASVFGSLSVFNQIMTDITGGGGKALALQWLDEWAKRFGQMSFLAPVTVVLSAIDEWFPKIVTPPPLDPHAHLHTLPKPNVNSSYYSDSYGTYRRNGDGGREYDCVYYANARIHELTGEKPGRPFQNQWPNIPKEYKQSEIRAHSVAYFQNSQGKHHAVIVEDVRTDNEGRIWVYFSESNYSSKTDCTIQGPIELSEFEGRQNNGIQGYVYF